MILTCSGCSTRYLVDPVVLGDEGRRVKCVKCEHTWYQRPPFDMPKPVNVAPTPASILPLPPGSNLPVLSDRRRRRPVTARWVTLLLVTAALVAAAYFGRTEMVAAWPAAARLYDIVGLPVESLGAGLALRNVHSEQRQENSVPLLVIEGQVVNASARDRVVPTIRATSYGPDRKVLETWVVTPSRDHLEPGGTATFESKLRDEGEPVTEVGVTFAAN